MGWMISVQPKMRTCICQKLDAKVLVSRLICIIESWSTQLLSVLRIIRGPIGKSIGLWSRLCVTIIPEVRVVKLG